ncbi:hypothetical protein LZ554_002459 [Drepanopeziza brunnea f. sp. 'monogermtubi']|nr:hypothetical protein LZ554_002459 [Drepanopeziza brunnea f. sp. 'monogermtubi']
MAKDLTNFETSKDPESEHTVHLDPKTKNPTRGTSILLEAFPPGQRPEMITHQGQTKSRHSAVTRGEGSRSNEYTPTTSEDGSLNEKVVVCYGEKGGQYILLRKAATYTSIHPSIEAQHTLSVVSPRRDILRSEH